jgi:hypothetical protein
MCFLHDYDWTAETIIEGDETATKRTKCDECYRLIEVGETLHRVFMQEHEQCHLCYETECECPKDEDGDCIECKCAEPAYGETFSYVCCPNCENFRLAVIAAEIAAGCSRNESAPSLGSMFEEIREAGPEEADKYREKASEMFPELGDWVAERWLKMFAEEEGQ